MLVLKATIIGSVDAVGIMYIETMPGAQMPRDLGQGCLNIYSCFSYCISERCASWILFGRSRKTINLYGTSSSIYAYCSTDFGFRIWMGGMAFICAIMTAIPLSFQWSCSCGCLTWSSSETPPLSPLLLRCLLRTCVCWLHFFLPWFP